MDFLPGFLRTPLAFIVVLGVLIFVHELGHYLAARWRGVHVEAFSIGFGRALVSWTDRRTRRLPGVPAVSRRGPGRCAAPAGAR